MKLIYFFAIVFAAAEANPRIVGGKNAAPGQFPHQVSIVHNTVHHCGGSIITERWVITAAHCVAEIPADELHILVGTNTLDKGGEIYDLTEGRVHLGWNKMTMEHDIAVLRTNRDIKFSNRVRFIPLNTQDIQPETVLQLSGWGYTSYPNTQPPNNLQFLNVSVISLNDCRLDEEIIFDTQMCTLSPRGQGSCTGDAGGPLIYKQTLVGIASFGRRCAVGRPDVYTDVAEYLEWIYDTITA